MADVDSDDAISALLRLDFAFFVRMAFRELGGNDAYLHNWHIDAIIYELDRVLTCDNRRLIVTLPPRHLKSRMISNAWVAWMLGNNPALNFLCASYGQDLADDHASECLKIMQSRWYRRAFPSLVLTTRAVSHFKTSAGGGRKSTSVGGSITGFGADIIVVDDPLKSQDALSATARDTANRWLDQGIMQRSNSQMTGSIIVVMQRLHEADPVGYLKKQGGFHELCLPAIATKDEIVPLTRGRFYRRREGCALHPERQSLAMLQERRTASPYVFASQFQQDPIPEIGNIVEAAWLQWYDFPTLDLAQGQIVMSLDSAGKDNPFNDYSAIVIARVLGKFVHIIDVYRARLKVPVLRAKTIELARLHCAQTMLIEDASSGEALLHLLQAETPPGVPVPIGRRPKGDKTSRVLEASALIQAGRLFLPEKAHWLEEYTRELLGFPGAAFDDQVDATSQLLLWVQQKDVYRELPSVGPITFVDGEWSEPGIVLGYGEREFDPWGAY